ncbi:MAG: hypothetical protein IKK92_10415 [Prevotella sp.]|nr:hypothetical protein [Prevotella sp.]
MFRFEESYQPGPDKFLCDGWCCGYAPSPHDPREPEEVLSEEEQAHIAELKQRRVYSKCYFESLEEIYKALDFELWYCIQRYKVREAQGEFTFKGQTYSYARIFDFETDSAWVEIKDGDGNVLYGRNAEGQ